MIGSLFTAITGLQSFQQQLNVVSNNIANVNTIGFKGSNTIFESIISQTLKGATAPTPTSGGMNPNQIGLGVQVTNITPIFTQGTVQTTGRPTDLMIQGNGFFMLNSNGGNFYTRDGAFSLDANGNLVNPTTGMNVMGYQSQGAQTPNPPGPQINYNAPLGPINIPNTFASYSISNAGIVTGVSSTGVTTVLGQIALITFPNPTGLLAQGNNLFVPTLNSGQSNYVTTTTPQFTPGTAIVVTTPGVGLQVPIPSIAPPAGVTTTPTTLTVGTSTPWTAVMPVTSMQMQITVPSAGAPTGNLVVNGTSVALTYTAGPPATFAAPAAYGTMTLTMPTALPAPSSGNYSYTVNLGTSGGATGIPGSNGIGTVTAGALEMSNVDLGREFSNMIIAERGFQANSKSITTADSILTTLVNMKSQ